jgi:hypothetical protein
MEYKDGKFIQEALKIIGERIDSCILTYRYVRNYIFILLLLFVDLVLSIGLYKK